MNTIPISRRGQGESDPPSQTRHENDTRGDRRNSLSLANAVGRTVRTPLSHCLNRRDRAPDRQALLGAQEPHARSADAIHNSVQCRCINLSAKRA